MRLKKVLFRTVCLLAISGCIQANTTKQLARTNRTIAVDPPVISVPETPSAPSASDISTVSKETPTAASKLTAASKSGDVRSEATIERVSVSPSSGECVEVPVETKAETAASSRAETASAVSSTDSSPNSEIPVVVHAKTDPTREEPTIVHAKTDPVREEPTVVHAKTDPAREEPIVVHAKTDPAYEEPDAAPAETPEDISSETTSSKAGAPVPGVDIPLVVHAKTGWEEIPVAEPVIQEAQITASCDAASEAGNSYAASAYGMTWDPTLSFDNSSYRFPGYTSIYSPQQTLNARSCEAVDATFQQLMQINGFDISRFRSWRCNVYNYMEGQFFVTYVFYAS